MRVGTSLARVVHRGPWRVRSRPPLAREVSMESITPARTRISDRFPVASFTVRAPEKRYFEIACATDPTLFHVSQKGKRTPRNFFSSSARGLIRGSREGMTYMMPPDQLQQFAGAKRLYYALATYGGPRWRGRGWMTWRRWMSRSIRCLSN